MRPSDMYRQSMSDMSALAAGGARRPQALEKLHHLVVTFA